jgi:hypothetical protein
MIGKKNEDSIETGFEFKAEMSRSISRFYYSTMILLGVLVGVIVIFAPLIIMMKILIINLFSCIEFVLFYLFIRAYRTLYTVKPYEIKVYGAMGTKTIAIDEIESIKKNSIPSGFRLFGSSFLGGWYYFRGIGKTWVSMTNFKDGVLISTKDDKKYMITPKNPEKFIEIVKKRISRESTHWSTV